MRWRKLLVLSMWLFAGSTNGSAQDVVARISADTNRILIGKPIRLNLQLSQPKSLNIEWPVFTDSLGGMEILQYFPPDTMKVDDPNILLRSQTITVTSFDSGGYVIPSIVFNYKVAGVSKDIVIETDPLSIEVYSVPVDTTLDIRDIRPVEKAPFDPMWIIWALLAYHVLLILIALVVWYLNKRNAVGEVVNAPVVARIPAHIIALEALTTLEGERVWQNGQVKLYYTRLTDILRQYIERRWLVNAMELTSDEILEHGFVNTIDKLNKEELERVLRLADLVKFAKWQATPGENEWSMQLSLKFVSDTAFVENVNNNNTLSEA